MGDMFILVFPKASSEVCVWKLLHGILDKYFPRYIVQNELRLDREMDPNFIEDQEHKCLHAPYIFYSNLHRASMRIQNQDTV